MNTFNVARTPQARRASPNPRPASSRLIDDRAAEEVHQLADKLVHDLEALKVAIDYINASTIEELTSNRKRARRLLVAVWADVAPVARALAEPPPKFRRDTGHPMPIVRRRVEEYEPIADFELPAGAEVAS